MRERDRQTDRQTNRLLPTCECDEYFDELQWWANHKSNHKSKSQIIWEKMI